MSAEGRRMREGGREMNAAAFHESPGESKIGNEERQRCAHRYTGIVTR